MSKLRVLCLFQLPPPTYGAALRSQDFLGSDIVSESINTDFVDIGTSKNISDVESVSPFKFIITFRIFCEVLFKIITFKPDVAYITLSASGPAVFKDTFIVFILRIFRIKVVCHMRNRGLNNTINKLGILGKLIAQILKGAKYIVMSNKLSQDISKVCCSPKVIPNCLTNNEKLLSKEVLRTRLKNIKIVFLSNVSEEKGALLYLKIAKHVNDLRPKNDISFEVYGNFYNEVEKEKFESLLSEEELTNVHYNGPIYGDDKFKMLESATLMLFPTKYQKECFPGVIMESFLCSVPVISRNIAAVSEIIEHGVNGYVFELNSDPLEYAKAIISIIYSTDDKYIEFCDEAVGSYVRSMKHTVVHHNIIEYLKYVSEKQNN